MFVPHNAYHTFNMSLILPYLDLDKYEVIFVNLGKYWHDEGAGREIKRLNLSSMFFNRLILIQERPDILFVMNDWGGVVGKKVIEANMLGIQTVGLVEGVQDFQDTHIDHIGVGRRRFPYQHVTHPYLTGEYDKKFIKSRNSKVVGIPRIEPLLNEKPVFPEEPLIVINSNFTYGLYTTIQQKWIEDVVRVCLKSGFDYIITQHHADKLDLSDYNLARNEHLHDTIRRGTLLISRFSTCLLESMALGKPVVYYNPHGEIVDTFQDPMGAFDIASNEKELQTAILRSLQRKEIYRDICKQFFSSHVSITDVPSAKRIALELINLPKMNFSITGMIKSLSSLFKKNPIEHK